MIYLDNNATTPIDDEVVYAMEPYLREEYGNPSSKFYTLAANAEKAVNLAREKVANLIHSDPKEIIFTSSATESNNFIIKGIADYMRYYEEKGNHIITSKVEHQSIINTCRFLNGEIYMNKEKRKNLNKEGKVIDRGYEVDFLDVNEFGQVQTSIILKKIKHTTILGSIIWANNEIGNLNDINEIANLFKNNGVLFHTDATQAIGRVQVDVKKTPIDFMSFSAHKLYGPKGIGAAYIKSGKYSMPDITSLIHGGDNQEFGYRAGTLSVHNIVGFGKAAEIAKRDMNSYIIKLEKLEVEFKKLISTKYPDIIFLTDPRNHVPGVVSFIIPRTNNMMYIKSLSDKVAMSSGSACSITGESHVLSAINRLEYNTNFFRVSFNKFNTEEEIIKLKDIL
ncbi:cysteine desulfurase [Tissierella carlieri]|uniref:cysteine desulfurase family protein n=1 Tax=Tissierella carlieri TaxID=689904 RepID=UPI001C11E5E2|nr:cysteine desulfurase family protein [Tissierella carlieri]MBU5310594.1 cysteine desulfurase [Tissierella carlieri]